MSNLKCQKHNFNKVKGLDILYTATYMNMTSSGLQFEEAY